MPDPVDDELRVTAALAAQRRDELVAEGQPGMAEYMNNVAAAAADLRAERRALAREVDAAMVTVTDLGILPDDDPPDPGREERLTVAVAEWQAGTARPSKTAVVCPHRDRTAAQVLNTSVGWLFVASPPAPHEGRRQQRQFGMLLDAGGWADVECRRCARTYRADLDKIRRDVLAGATMTLIG